MEMRRILSVLAPTTVALLLALGVGSLGAGDPARAAFPGSQGRATTSTARASTTGEQVVFVDSAGQGVATLTAAHKVAPRSAGEGLVAGLGTNLVAAQHCIPALFSRQGVRTPEAQQVVAAVALQGAGAVRAPDGVVAGAARDGDRERHPAYHHQRRCHRRE